MASHNLSQLRGRRLVELLNRRLLWQREAITLCLLSQLQGFTQKLVGDLIPRQLRQSTIPWAHLLDLPS